MELLLEIIAELLPWPLSALPALGRHRPSPQQNEYPRFERGCAQTVRIVHLPDGESPENLRIRGSSHTPA